MEELKKWNEILNQFKKFPENKREKTFIEVCSPPRFEEVCSRLWRFFLDPNEVHKLGTLFLESLLKLSNHTDLAEKCDGIGINVKNEEHTVEQKRIDIFIVAPKFVIGIENKIDAKLYNDLKAYRSHSLSYGKDNTVNIVLSMRRLNANEETECQKEECAHDIVYYDDLINEIESNMGSYMATCNQQWLIYLCDFIKTLKTRGNMTAMDKIDDFLIKNGAEIQKLYDRYQESLGKAWNLQIKEIPVIKAAIEAKCKKETGEETIWDVYALEDLLYQWNKDKNPIGIECGFKLTREGGALGSFTIQISTWAKSDWKHYQNSKTFQELIKEGNLLECPDGPKGKPMIIRFDPIPASDFGENYAVLIDRLYDLFIKVEKVVEECPM